MNTKILSLDDIESIRSEITQGMIRLQNYTFHLDYFISLFENEEVTQSFFASGNFGKEQQEKIIQLKSVVARLSDKIVNDLEPATSTFLANQEALNNTGNN